MIEILVAVIAFTIGTVLGSFYTLAIYRIPLNQNITHERSYCPKCNHKLNFIDLIPILSYVFLRGKCRYCGDKIRPRYLILEISSGILFMLYILSLRLDYFNLQTGDLVNILFGMIYLSVLAITAGIDLENKKIIGNMMKFTIIISIIYMLYLYILGANMYRYIIYFIIIACLLIIGKIKPNYTLDVVAYILLILLYVGTEASIVAIILTLITMSLKNIFNIIRKKQKEEKFTIAGVFSIITIGIIIIQNYIMVR